MKRILMLSSMILVVLFLAACGISGQPATLSSGNIKIVTTIFPPYDFAREIAKDKADITLLLKPGAESHSFEPTPQDIKTIENADLFSYTGSENDVDVYKRQPLCAPEPQRHRQHHVHIGTRNWSRPSQLFHMGKTALSLQRP